MPLPRRPRLVGAVLAAVLGVLVSTTGCTGTAIAGRPVAAADPPAPAAPAPAPDLFTTGTATPRDHDDGLWLSWSLVDTARGTRTGSANSTSERTNAESSIKAWIAADYLRVAGDQGRTVRESELTTIDAAIRRSDDDAAERLYRALGADAVLRHLSSACGVTVSTSRRGYWSFAQITAVDATRILECVVRDAPRYPGGERLLTDLRNVDPDNAFGIKPALPAGATVAVKNGWTAHAATGEWNVNCVAAWDTYVLAVLTRYPAGRQLGYGADVCRDVTATLVAKLPR
jgi:hypothetical protein